MKGMSIEAILQFATDDPLDRRRPFVSRRSHWSVLLADRLRTPPARQTATNSRQSTNANVETAANVAEGVCRPTGRQFALYVDSVVRTDDHCLHGSSILVAADNPRGVLVFRQFCLQLPLLHSVHTVSDTRSLFTHSHWLQSVSRLRAPFDRPLAVGLSSAARRVRGASAQVRDTGVHRLR